MPSSRYFVEGPDGKKVRVPSVTQIVKRAGSDSEGLIYWAWKVGFDGESLDEARRRPAGVGTVVHAMIEADARGLPAPDLAALDDEMRGQATEAYGAYLDWRARHGLTIVAVETELVSKAYMFGGRFDMVILDGDCCLVDFKASNGIYTDHLVQLAGYGILWNEAHPREPVMRFDILRVGKDSGAFHHHSWPARSMEPARRSFLLAREQHDMQAEMKKLL